MDVKGAMKLYNSPSHKRDRASVVPRAISYRNDVQQVDPQKGEIQGDDGKR